MASNGTKRRKSSVSDASDKSEKKAKTVSKRASSKKSKKDESSDDESKEEKELPFLNAEEEAAIANKKAKGGSITGFSLKDYTAMEDIDRDRAAKDAADFVHPSDWPADGDIKLEEQDLPHATADTEWWYVNCHLKATTGKGKKAETREFSVFTSFFRIAKDTNEKGKMTHAHAITWAIVDVDNKKYYPDALLDHTSPETLKEQLEEGTYELDSRMRRAFLEVVNQGEVPLPDRLMEAPCAVSTKKLDLQYDSNYFRKEKKNYTFHCNNGEKGDKLNDMTITLVPKKKAIRQGHNGVVKVGLKTDTMMYYFIPRCEASGEITVEGKTYKVEGQGWYDHEFGGEIRPHKKVYNKEKADKAAAVIAAAKAAEKAAKEEAKAAKKAAAAAKKAAKSKKGSKKASADNGDDVDESEDGKTEVKAAAAASTADVPSAVATAAATNVVATPKEETKEEKKDGNGVAKKKEEHYAWNWLSCQLDDGTDISSTTLVQPKAKVLYDNYTVVIGPNSERSEHADSTMLGVVNWSSCRTAQDYPTLWELEVPSAEIKLQLKAAFPEQELISLIAKPAFWEGRLSVQGTIKGKAVKGLAFIERQGFQSIDSLDSFFKRISVQVKGEIERMLPLNPTEEQTLLLASEKQYPHFLHGGNRDVFASKVIAPIREVVDRGGKSWRSFAFLLCIDAVGGFSHKYKHWLAMPEIMHVGSLIVDDIQDKSETRRGGPSCHKTYGEAIAINAGTAAYFLAMHISHSQTKDMPDHVRLKMYDMYMLTLRAGHVGQAFDINGQDYMMDDVVEGKIAGSVLVDRVTCTHRLKSAVPAGNLARMGALVVEVPESQVEALGLYFEAIGVAFQIIDDVLNLRGFEGNGKKRGEDINAGKITFPVALAMSKLDKADRGKLWAIVKSKPEEDRVVDEAIALIDKVDAVNGSVQISKDMVETAWKLLDKEIPNSFYKLMLRAFGWYVLERHY